MKNKADEAGKEWTSSYLFHIPLKKGSRKKKVAGVNLEGINGVENDGGENDDIMMGQGTQEQRADSVDRLIESHDNM